MNGWCGRGAGTSSGRQWANLFEITNGSELTLEYRLLAVRGLPPGDAYDKNLNRLVKQVAYEIKQPVALVRRDDLHQLAIPADGPLPALEQRLIPHVASLRPESGAHPLTVSRLDATTAPIAVAFLQYAFRRPLWRDRQLWESGRACFGKRPLNAGDPSAGIDIYPGLVWNVVAQEDGRLFLAVDTRTRYIDRRWLADRLAGSGEDPRRYFLRHCLYQFGHQWYVVQFRGTTGLSVAEQHFVLEGTGEVASVLDYTQARWAPDAPPWVRDLDPDSPAIVYRYPGNEKDRHGALALCRLTYSTADAEVAGLHRRSILDPRERFERTARVVARHFQHARLGDRPIRLATGPAEVERRVFGVPAQRFGQDRLLGVAAEAPPGQATPAPPVTDSVPLHQLGRRRLELVLDPQAGPLDTNPFDAQYLLVPRSVPRAINEDFERRFVRAMREVSGQPGYAVQRVLYDDRGATSLYKQVQAIKEAIAQNGMSHGYALLVLPPQAKRDLHNYIKTELWPHIQIQCAAASKLQGYYERPRGGDGAYRVAPDRAGKLVSYVRNCALGMMVVNRKWAWSLATPLHYEVYVGIDVLNRMAGLTFVYNDGRQIYFENHKSKQPERLTTSQTRDILLKNLHAHLAELGLRPRSLVIHRDGRMFPSELTGLRAAVRELQKEWLLPLDVVVGVVDIRKTSAAPLRLVEGQRWEAAENPTIGSYRVSGAREGIVCTTGRPFRFPGTAKPLAAVIVDGALEIEWVLEDIFALSQLVFTAPDRCARLPVTIKLADDLLEPIAGAADEDAARYDDDNEEWEEAADEPVSPPDGKPPVDRDATRVDVA